MHILEIFVKRSRGLAFIYLNGLKTESSRTAVWCCLTETFFCVSLTYSGRSGFLSNLRKQIEVQASGAFCCCFKLFIIINLQLSVHCLMSKFSHFKKFIKGREITALRRMSGFSDVEFKQICFSYSSI